MFPTEFHNIYLNTKYRSGGTISDSIFQLDPILLKI